MWTHTHTHNPLIMRRKQVGLTEWLNYPLGLSRWQSPNQAAESQEAPPPQICLLHRDSFYPQRGTSSGDVTQKRKGYPPCPAFLHVSLQPLLLSLPLGEGEVSELHAPLHSPGPPLTRWSRQLASEGVTLPSPVNVRRFLVPY